ncbi:adenylate/guanylate cyclase domain-containing protein [Breoghania sp. L-A4]|uniref:adenylate/guanylate cyclase domain-containing protein n=1 Tax=Breoghania sp. L-A4 TaxID=2304600 RepID=UPI000E35F322|nr:adenylate/guanylate cyclase domain-containing protein [Breoghania sp. L-A4]AXS39999.1 adenylate/guanylate cyclase domain-containing protein [Breoghania sp. L-A4]
MGDGRRRRLPIAWVVGGAFTALLGVSIAVVVGLSMQANFSNTFSLLNDKAVLIADSLEYRLRANLDPVAETVQRLGGLHEAGAFELADKERVLSFLTGALAAHPGITALLVLDMDDRELSAVRTSDGSIEAEGWYPVPAERRRQYPVDEVRAASGPTWGPLVTVPEGVFTNVTVPLKRAGEIIAYLTAATSIDFLTDIVTELDTGPEMSNFILAQGAQVLAFSDLEPLRRASPETEILLPLPVDRFADPVLRAMAQAPVLERFSQAQAEGVDVRHIEAGREDYILMSRALPGYGPHDWIIGAYFQRASLGGEVRRMMISGIAGVVALIVASVLALWLARTLSRPLTHIATQSRRVAAMEIDDVQPLPHSRMAEIDQLAVAFNAMVSGLRALNTYVPASLFRKLMGLGMAEAARSREAELTMLFTDIAGFTTQSEAMSASEVARFLNGHFALLVRAVEDEDGTVDKFLGDGMLAFWGAPDERADHADAAVRAARAIVKAQHAANVAARAAGETLTQLRIGIHTGRVVVGNIGAYDRVDYTIVGDAVNVTQRLQDFGRIVGPHDETVVLASGETVSALNLKVPRASIGQHHLRGRGSEIDVWRLFSRDIQGEG